MRELQVGRNDAKQRLDRFLNKVFPKATASFLQKMIRQKKIKVNKKRAEANSLIKEGDRIQIYLYEEVLVPLEEKRVRPKTTLHLSYAFQNEDFAVIDKPCGVLSHPANSADYGKTVVDALISDLIASGEYVPRLEKSFVPALINRLDMQTAGLLVGAKNHRAMLILQEALREGRIEKYYLAYVEGCVDQPDTVALPLITENGMSRVDANGKACLTHYKPLLTRSRFSLLEIRLETGRTHQIRAHMAAIGHPLIGDRAYGAQYRLQEFKHHLLLSHRLQFLNLEALALPERFNVYSKKTEQFQSLSKQLERGKG